MAPTTGSAAVELKEFNQATSCGSTGRRTLSGRRKVIQRERRPCSVLLDSPRPPQKAQRNTPSPCIASALMLHSTAANDNQQNIDIVGEDAPTPIEPNIAEMIAVLTEMDALCRQAAANSAQNQHQNNSSVNAGKLLERTEQNSSAPTRRISLEDDDSHSGHEAKTFILPSESVIQMALPSASAAEMSASDAPDSQDTLIISKAQNEFLSGSSEEAHEHETDELCRNENARSDKTTGLVDENLLGDEVTPIFPRTEVKQSNNNYAKLSRLSHAGELISEKLEGHELPVTASVVCLILVLTAATLVFAGCGDSVPLEASPTAAATAESAVPENNEDNGNHVHQYMYKLKDTEVKRGPLCTDAEFYNNIKQLYGKSAPAFPPSAFPDISLERWFVDEMEDELAAVADETGEIWIVYISQLPQGIREGDYFIVAWKQSDDGSGQAPGGIPDCSKQLCCIDLEYAHSMMAHIHELRDELMADDDGEDIIL